MKTHQTQSGKSTKVVLPTKVVVTTHGNNAKLY